MANVNVSFPTRRQLEWFLALLAAAICSLISIRLYSVVASMQPLWPLPALYLVEVTSLGWLAAWALNRPKPRSAVVTCAAAGALAGFSILGVWSIGLYYLPVALLLGIAGALSAWRARLSLLLVLAAFAAAGAGQVVLMLARPARSWRPRASVRPILNAPRCSTACF
jgi:hypothetical protein